MMKDKNQYQASRRHAIKMMSLSTVMLSAPFVITPSRASKRRIVVRDAGGVYLQTYTDVFYKPFTQATGIEVVGVTSGPEPIPIAQIRMMVETHRYEWDMAAISDRAVQLLTNGQVYLEKHELEHKPFISSIPPQFMSPYGVGRVVHATVLAYRTDAFKGHRTPASWQDLWNIDHFPGRRSLRKDPYDTLEEALMGDSVPPSDVYPCDLDRAFRSLDKIKPHVAVWWTSGPQVEQLLKSGEVDMAPIWNYQALSAMKVAAVAFSWEQNIHRHDCWAILKGTPHAELCRQFIQFASDPKRQAQLAEYGLGPTQSEAFNAIEAKRAKNLPSYPDNLKKGLYTDTAYWLKHEKAVFERFNDWLMS